MSEVMNKAQIPANAALAATAASGVPAGTPAAPQPDAASQTPLEARLAAIEAQMNVLFAVQREIKDKMAVLDNTFEYLADAWMHFSQAGEAALAIARQASGAEAFTSLDTRLKVIEASRV